MAGLADRRGHLHREKADVRADVDRRIAACQRTTRERGFVDLVPPAHDVQADHVIGEINEQTHAGLDLLDHDRPIVGMGVIRVLLLKLAGRHQVLAQCSRVA